MVETTRPQSGNKVDYDSAVPEEDLALLPDPMNDRKVNEVRRLVTGPITEE